MQKVCWRSNLWTTAVTTVFLTWTHGVHMCQATDTSGLVLTPTEIQRQAAYAVQWMLVMCGCQFLYCLVVFVCLNCWLDVQAGATYANSSRKLPLKAWVNLIQGG